MPYDPPAVTPESPPKPRFPLILPPPIHTMAPTTAADREKVERAFMAQHDRVATLKDLAISSEGVERTHAAADLVDAVVRAILPAFFSRLLIGAPPSHRMLLTASSTVWTGSRPAAGTLPTMIPSMYGPRN